VGEIKFIEVTYVFIGLLILIAIIDLIWYRIPNTLIILLALTVVANILLNENTNALSTIGWFTVWTTVGVILFVVGAMAGGDVKLLALIGAWFGLKQTFAVLIVACLIGAMLGIIKYACNGVLKERASIFINAVYLKMTRTKGDVGFSTLSHDINEKVPIGAVPFGTCLVISITVNYFIVGGFKIV